MAGVGDHRETVPDELTVELRRVAGEMDVPLTTMVHAAHARVLSALTGEREVATGYGSERRGRATSRPTPDRGGP